MARLASYGKGRYAAGLNRALTLPRFDTQTLIINNTDSMPCNIYI